MAGDKLLNAASYIGGAVFLVVSIYIYASLWRQIGNRHKSGELSTENHFGLPEAAVALALATLFSVVSASSGSTQIVRLGTRDLIANANVALSLVAFLTAILKLRRLQIGRLAGLMRLSFRRAFGIGFVLIIAAYPLIVLADWVTARVLGTTSSRQGIIELFSDSPVMQQRVIIIVLAVAIAPFAEEFIFRFFLYGVLRRYAGRAVGLVLSSLLVAAVHAHLPSFAPLFVLASCFTLAYEWSGSLLVSMTMHA